jgi:hypothetical protein
MACGTFALPLRSLGGGDTTTIQNECILFQMKQDGGAGKASSRIQAFCIHLVGRKVNQAHDARIGPSQTDRPAIAGVFRLRGAG